MVIGLLSYGIAAAAFAVLTVLLLVSWRGGRTGALLALACLVSGIWAAIWAVETSDAHDAATQTFTMLGLIAEWLRAAAWFAFLLALCGGARDPGERGWSGLRVLRVVAMLPLAFMAFVLVSALVPQLALPDAMANLLGVALLSVSLVGMLMVEQLARRVTVQNRWGVKHLSIGLGLVFAFDFYLAAENLLFHGVSLPVWEARGIVNALSVPLIAVSAARNPNWSLRLSVSRRAVLESVTIAGAGLYLLVMAAAGYYIRYAGGTWGGFLQIVFLAAALTLLIAVLTSGSARAWLKVMLVKHFFTYRYDYRGEWLRFIETLAGESREPMRERIIQGLGQILDSPAGMLWSRTETGGFNRVATWNIGMSGTAWEPADSPFIRFLEQREWVIDLKEFESQPDAYPGLEPPGWLTEWSQARVVIPLMGTTRLEGVVVLAEPLAPRPLNWEDRDLLKTAGRQAAGYMVLLQTTEALIDARQFEAFNRLSAYVVHDLKNVVGQLTLVTRNASRHGDDPQFIADAFHTVENATAKMQRVLNDLRHNPAHEKTDEPVNVHDVLRSLARAAWIRSPSPVVDGDPDVAVCCSRIGLVTVVEHLVSNAQDATPDDGEIRLSCRRDGDGVILEVADTGEGMDPAFIRDRLFRPFQTTKGNAGMGIGVYETKQFMERLGGSVEVETRPGRGTTFRLRFPSSVAEPQEISGSSVTQEATGA